MVDMRVDICAVKNQELDSFNVTICGGASKWR
jgi:hypothetical protein